MKFFVGLVLGITISWVVVPFAQTQISSTLQVSCSSDGHLDFKFIPKPTTP